MQIIFTVLSIYLAVKFFSNANIYINIIFQAFYRTKLGGKNPPTPKNSVLSNCNTENEFRS